MEFTPEQHKVLQRARTRWRLRDLLTIEELSVVLGVSERTIQRMHASGYAPPRIKVSKQLLYRIPELIEWLKKHGDSRIGPRKPQASGTGSRGKMGKKT